MSALDPGVRVGVVGAGTMGAGIAQVASAAGHSVVLFDAADGAAARGIEGIANGLQGLVGRGKMDEETAQGITDRIAVTETIEDLKECGLVVEAIVENLDVKQNLFKELEKLTSDDAILATNTSSISVTAIGAALDRPEQLVGMHFFNPAPIMKLVEVISGLATDRTVVDCIVETSRAWGKQPAEAKSTPGFIVNRVARPFYGEAIKLLEEGIADTATIDALLVESAGFRMGPFKLMDLIGHDVNYSVTESVFNAFHNDPRYRPSLTQAELIAAGWLGRKTGRGFYDYQDGAPAPEPAQLADVSGPSASGNILVALSDGRTAKQREIEEGRPVIIHDFVSDASGAARIGFAASPGAAQTDIVGFAAEKQAQDLKVTQLEDTPGLVVLRTIAMLVNEAFEAVHQDVAERTSIDVAMKYGVNYPVGPFEWADTIGAEHILKVLDTLFDLYHDPRYRASLALRRAAGAV